MEHRIRHRRWGESLSLSQIWAHRFMWEFGMVDMYGETCQLGGKIAIMKSIRWRLSWGFWIISGCLCVHHLWGVDVQWKDAQSWSYQLQHADIDQLAQDPSFDVVVIDYSGDGSAGEQYSADEIEKLKAAGKIPLAYFSIGEAEDYRWYWNPAWTTSPESARPTWLAQENPHWPGNYLVKFWEEEWKSIIHQYLSQIEAAGFSGIYLDKVDAWYDWIASGIRTDPVQPAVEMVRFVTLIKSWTETLREGGMILVIQNGETLINEDVINESMIGNWMDSIDGVGTEDLFYFGDQEMDNPFQPDEYRLGILDEYVKRGKRIFSIEYLTESSSKWHFYKLAKSYGFVPLVAGRPLAEPAHGVKIVEKLSWNQQKLHHSTIPGRAYRILQSQSIQSESVQFTDWHSSDSLLYEPDFSEETGFFQLEIDLFPAQSAAP